MLNEKDGRKEIIDQIAMEWQKVERRGLSKSRELILYGFVGHAGELYRKRLERLMESMEETANHLWEGTRL